MGSLALTVKEAPQESQVTLIAVLTTQEWDPPQTMFLMPTLWGNGFAVLHFQIPQFGQNFALLIGRLGHRPRDLLIVVN